MNEADIKLRIIRLIDNQKGEVLQELYNIIVNRLGKEKKYLDPLEQGYKEMSEDQQREEEAFQWIEGTFNPD